MSSTVSLTVTEEDQPSNESTATVHCALPPPQPRPTLYHHPQKKDTFAVKWTRLHPSTSKYTSRPVPRHGHRAIAYKHLMVVFSGGNEGLLMDVCVYNTLSNEWTFPNIKGTAPLGRASYGAAIDGHRILIYGGTEEQMRFTDTLYELNVQRWEWTLLQPKARTLEEKPCARIGHSFTLIKEKVFMFGGLADVVSEDGEMLVPRYLNELHCLMLRQNMQNGVWMMPVSYGTIPCPRESHSAVAYASKDSRHNKLIIFGGMFGNRLGDLFTLDVDTLMWCQIKYDGRTLYPLARSLHSASLIGDKMYVFGGWVQANPREKVNGDYIMDGSMPWRCDNVTNCLNLKTNTWERVFDTAGMDEELPGPRAGHSAAVINNRIYIWSGRDGYSKSTGKEAKQVCYEDLWKVDVQKPGTPDKVRLRRAKADSLVVEWDLVPGADGYLLQCMIFDIPQSATVVDKSENVVPKPCNWVQRAPPTPVGAVAAQQPVLAICATGQQATLPPSTSENVGVDCGPAAPFQAPMRAANLLQQGLRPPVFLGASTTDNNSCVRPTPMYFTTPTSGSSSSVRAPMQLTSSNQLSFRGPLHFTTTTGNQLAFRGPVHFTSGNPLSLRGAMQLSNSDQQPIRTHVATSNLLPGQTPVYIHPTLRAPLFVTTGNQAPMRAPLYITNRNQLSLRAPAQGQIETGQYFLQAGTRPIFIRLPRMSSAPPTSK